MSAREIPKELLAEMERDRKLIEQGGLSASVDSWRRR